MLLESLPDNFRMSEITGKIISRRLTELGVTQEWLAEKMGVSINAVSKWTRTGRIARQNVKGVAEALGITISELLGEAPPKKASAQEVLATESVAGAQLVYATPVEISILTSYRESNEMGKNVILAACRGAPKQSSAELPPRRSNEAQ